TVLGRSADRHSRANRYSIGLSLWWVNFCPSDSDPQMRRIYQVPACRATLLNGFILTGTSFFYMYRRESHVHCFFVGCAAARDRVTCPRSPKTFTASFIQFAE